MLESSWLLTNYLSMLESAWPLTIDLIPQESAWQLTIDLIMLEGAWPLTIDLIMLESAWPLTIDIIPQENASQLTNDCNKWELMGIVSTHCDALWSHKCSDLIIFPHAMNSIHSNEKMKKHKSKMLKRMDVIQIRCWEAEFEGREIAFGSNPCRC